MSNETKTDSAPDEVDRVVPPEVAEALAQITADREAATAQAAAAAKAEDDRNAELEAAKQVCFDTCGPICDILKESTDPAERAALIDLEARTHGAHKDALEEAYLKHSGQRRGDSNPASPGVNEVESGVSVVQEVPSA